VKSKQASKQANLQRYKHVIAFLHLPTVVNLLKAIKQVSKQAAASTLFLSLSLSSLFSSLAFIIISKQASKQRYSFSSPHSLLSLSPLPNTNKQASKQATLTIASIFAIAATQFS